MERYQALSLVLLGVVIGLGYAIACGNPAAGRTAGDNSPMLPGVGIAMAQSPTACAQWEAVYANNGLSLTGETIPVELDGEVPNEIRAVPAGWTPLTGPSEDGALWLVRCKN